MLTVATELETTGSLINSDAAPQVVCDIMLFEFLSVRKALLQLHVNAIEAVNPPVSAGLDRRTRRAYGEDITTLVLSIIRHQV
jgi:hypothetical protein